MKELFTLNAARYIGREGRQAGAGSAVQAVAQACHMVQAGGKEAGRQEAVHGKKKKTEVWWQNGAGSAGSAGTGRKGSGGGSQW